MKNFTNNFKQFTSRLSARWLILALMMLVGTSSAWAKIFYSGDIIYVDATDCSWYEGDGCNASIYFWGTNTTGPTHMTRIAERIYSYTFTSQMNVSNFKVFRQPTSSSGWDNQYNGFEGNFDSMGSHNTIKVNSSSNGFSWSTYTPPCTPPTLTLTTTSATVNKGETVNLTTLSVATASNGGTIEWSTSTTGSPVIDANVTISATKTYYAKAVKDGCKSASKSITITAACSKDFYLVGSDATLFGTAWEPKIEANKMVCDLNTLTKTYTNITVAANTTIEYKYTGSSGWGDAEYPSSGNASFTIPTAGTYNITFTATTDGSKITGTPAVTWEQSCTSAKVTISDWNISTLCPGSSGTFKYTAAQGVTVTWEMNENNSDYAIVSDNGTVTITYKGTSTTNSNKLLYTVSGDGICPEEDVDSKKTISTAAKPSISALSDPTQTICDGTNATLTVTSGKGTYNWVSSNGGEEITLTSNSVPVSIAGTYTVTATQNGCESEPIEFTVSVTPVPAINDFDITLPNNPTYNGRPQNAIVTPKNGITGMGDVNISYYKGGQKTDPINAGEYTVKISVAAGDSYCAMDETEIGTFTINKADQTTALTITASTNICGKEATFSVTGGDGTGDYSYSLDKNDAGVSLNGTTLTATQNGSVTLKVKKLGDTNYNDSQETTKEFNFTMPIENVELAIIEGESATGKYCVGHQIKFQLTYTGSTPTFDTENFSWILDNFESEISNNVGGIASGATWTTTLGANDTSLKLKLKDCNGSWKESTPITFEVYERPSAPVFNPNSITVCQGQPFTLPGSEAEGYIWSDATGKPTTPNKPNGIDATAEYYAVISFGCPSDATLYTVNVNKIPTITGASVTQTNKEITLESAAGADTEWSVSPTENVTLTDNRDGTATFVATANGDYTITASNGVCAPVSHTIKVSDAFYIWVRNAKESDTAYGQFYYPNENSEAVRGGAMFYAECDALPTKDNYTTYNRGGRKADIVNDDCDGYTWYGFKASADVIAGTKYFYVHATNDLSDGGYYTHSKPLKSALSGDVYYTLGTTGDSYKGWNLSTASAPYAGPKVYALGSTVLGTNKFAALYVTDCSGKEITGYQWYKDGQPYSSVCSYVGKKGAEDSNAGLSNNIRPAEAGNYSCTVTYEDGTTATSAAVEISGSYNRSFTSNIPVLVVNTGSKGFPDCTGLSGQTASKNASTFKEKRSVDVKIYEGETLVYDRKARMNYRGSSSLNFVKKSYAFCPGDANCEEKDGQADYVKTAKLNMLGVGTACDKDWVLYAAAADPSLMRNRLVFDSYKAMTGKWGVNSRYVELIVDGVYKGVYVFMDKITMNNDRVKINEDKGFIVKFDKTDREDRVGGLNGVFGDEKTFKTSHTGKDDIGTYDTSIDQRFEIEYPEKDDYKTGWKARVDGIQGMFQAFEDALKQGDYATVQKYIDYTSWADWFIINEFTKNVDAYRASCIFVYTGEAGAKIEARPLWDQELSFNNQASNGTSDKGSNSTTGLLIQHSNVYSDAFGAPFWFTGGGSDITGGLLSDPCFVQVVKERWNMHQSGALSKKSLEDLVDEYEDDLAPEGTTENALKRETTFWIGKSRGTCDCSYDTDNATATGYQNKTFEESKGTITNWISDAAASEAKGRRAGLTTAINGLTGASFSIQIIPSEAKTTPWEPVEIAVSVTPAGYDYKLEYTDNDLGSVANTIIKEEGDKITYRIPRPSAWGTGDAEEGARADIEYGIKATLSVQEGTTVCGSQAAPSSTGKIILQDEDNDNCK